MKKIAKKGLYAVGALLACGTPNLTHAQDEASSVTSPLKEGAYIAPMGSYIFTDGPKTDDGYGGVLAGGYRLDWYALEFKGVYHVVDADTGDIKQSGGSVGGLVFPFESLPGLFGIVEVGGLSIEKYPATRTNAPSMTTKNIHTVTAGLGAGYLFGLSIGRYDFGVRAEALYRYGRRDQDVTPGGDINAPHNFGDVLVNVGLQLPLGLRPVEVAAAEPVAAVVPVETPPDSDGDGVPDDKDQCPGTPPGTQVDAVGCPLPPPPPPCKTPEAGQRVDLSGCAVGDTIVLHGVNFEFDKATLTVNAKTILDGVSDSLSAAPGINVEIGGHTDSRGSDSYNERLSERRAESVMQYLIGRGIAAERMSSHGYGETTPVADNETDEGRELNRRVELKITGSNAPAAPVAAEAPVAPSPAEAPAAEANPFADAQPIEVGQ